MTEALFRKQVFEARHNRWLGGVSLAQSTPLWLLSGFAGLAALLVVLFLFLGSYTRRSSVTGHLVPTQGLATVMAPVTGVVSTVSLAEGDRMQADQTVAVIDVPRATTDAGDTTAALERQLAHKRSGLQSTLAARQQQLQAQQLGLQQQLGTARRELAQVQAEIATRQQQVRIADETLQRLQQLTSEKYVSLIQVKQQEAAALAQRGEVQTLQRQAIGIQRLMDQLQQALRELPGQQQATQADYQRDLAALTQEQLETRARGQLAVRAPVGGVLATQIVKPGQAVQVGQPLMSVLPGDGKLEAELLVPSRAIGFIEPGDAVRLRYQAYPYQKFGHQQGTVTRISRSALSPGELGAFIGNAQAGEPYYRVTVTLARQAVTAYGQQESLKPGMLLDADILGEKRRLVEWILEPLYSLTGMFIKEQAETSPTKNQPKLLNKDDVNERN